MVFENVVAQMIRATGNLLYFHEFEMNNKKYEIDFLLPDDKKIIPIEVKSSGYKRHTSFDHFREKYHRRIDEAYIVYSKNYDHRDGVTYLPVYMCMCF